GQPTVGQLLGLLEDVARDRRVVREVEPETAGRDERPGLPRVIAQHVAQGPVDDMRRRVSPGGRLPTCGVALAVHLLALADLAGPDDPGVDDDVARPELRVGHRDRPAGGLDDTLVADLTAGLSVE